VFTVEPGLYFIPMLLRPFRDSEHKARFNWTLIDKLTPCGGIRIEDNLLVTSSGHRNLTRPHLPN
jgi:Xaa-Pro dipeptidase